MKRVPVLTFSIALFLLFGILAGSAIAGGIVTINHDTTEEGSQSGVNTEYIMVRFQDPPLASYEGSIHGLKQTKPEEGKLILTSTAAQAYSRRLDDAHASYRS